MTNLAYSAIYLLSCLMLGVIASYGIFASWRCWLFRQDLFDIRDAMWREMQKAGQLDNQFHREARNQINALIKWAPYWSIWSVIRMSLGDVPSGNRVDFTDAPEPVKASMKNAIDRCVAYIVKESAACVIIFLVGVAIMAVAQVKQKVADKVADYAMMDTIQRGQSALT